MRKADIAWVSCGLCLVGVLFVPYQAVGDAPGWRSFTTPEISDDAHVGQSFRMNGPGLSGFEFQAVPVGPVSGAFDLSLRSGTAERRVTVRGTDLVRSRSYTFRFEPVPDSTDSRFRFEIAPASADPGRGIALRATKGDRINEGALEINGVARWGSLVFNTRMTAHSPWHLLRRRSSTERPHPWLALVAACCAWVFLGFALRAVAADDDGMQAATPANDTPPIGAA